jgi:uncharacterized protein YdeI (YjbR/CyaY-like superfamily)
LNHKKENEIWLLYPLKTSGQVRIRYDDAVEEALCFGWIDGIAKRYDDQYSAQRFTPRKNKTKWSELNKHRVRNLIASNMMTEAGMATLPNLDPAQFRIAPDILSAIQSDESVWNNFQDFPEYYRHIRIGFIEEVRNNTAVFEKRLDNFLKQTALGKRFGSVK